MQVLRDLANKLQTSVGRQAPPPRHRDRAFAVCDRAFAVCDRAHAVGDELAPVVAPGFSPALVPAPNAETPEAETAQLLAKAVRVIKHIKTRCDAAEAALRQALETHAEASEAAASRARIQDERIEGLDRQVAELQEALRAAQASAPGTATPAAVVAQEPDAAPTILDLAVPVPRAEAEPAGVAALAERRHADADAIRQLLGWASAVLADQEPVAARGQDRRADAMERRLVA